MYFFLKALRKKAYPLFYNFTWLPLADTRKTDSGHGIIYDCGSRIDYRQSSCILLKN